MGQMHTSESLTILKSIFSLKTMSYSNSKMCPGCPWKGTRLASSSPDLQDKVTNIQSCYLVCLSPGDIRYFRNFREPSVMSESQDAFAIPSFKTLCKQMCLIADHPGNNAVVKQESLRSYINLT